MKNRYAFKNMNEYMARAVGKDLDISTKHAIEICNTIRGKRLNKAFDILENSINMKRAIPFKRFTGGAGHKPGIASGKFAVKACKEINRVIKSARANAQSKGLNPDELVIKHICAHKASTPLHYGRQIRRQMKKTHVEVVLEEIERKKKENKKKIAHDEKKKGVVKEELKIPNKKEVKNLTKTKVGNGDKPNEIKVEKSEFGVEDKKND